MGKSKPGAVGQNMPAALKGETAGEVSSKFKGKPRNADPHHPCNPQNAQPVDKWVKNHMKQRREEALQEKKEKAAQEIAKQ
uniref:Uncharacterized protein n=1 Tax=Panagrolaimus sp. JU765 TaxID=591449 RepID=A0AC34QPV8_9BILA